MENKSFRKPSLRENVIWNTIGSIIYWGTQWLTAIVLFREMGSSEAGVYQLSMAITAVFISIALFGMRSYQVSDVKRDYSDGTYMASRIFTVGAAFVAGVIFVLVNGYQTHFVICIILYLVFKNVFRVVFKFVFVLHRPYPFFFPHLGRINKVKGADCAYGTVYYETNGTPLLG